MMTHLFEDLEVYREAAYEALADDHPHYDEISDIIEQQILEDLEDYANTFPSTN